MIAYYYISGELGIIIDDIEYYGDIVTYHYSNDDIPRHAVIRCTAAGRAFFKTPSGRVHLDECLRVEG